MNRYSREVGTINKVLLAIEIVPISFILFLSLLLLSGSNLWLLALLITSILSMVSVIYLIFKTISGKSEVAKRFIYLAHSGFVITIIGVIALIIDGDSMKGHSPDIPVAIFSFGLVVLIPYMHVMIINSFFTKS